MNTIAGIIVASLSLLAMLAVGFHAVDDLLQTGNWIAAFFMTAILASLAAVTTPLLYYFTKHYKEFQ